MSREQRFEDNWALLAAADAARNLHRPLLCVFCFTPSFPNAQKRHYSFLIAGLKETQDKLVINGIDMHFLFGDPAIQLSIYAEELNASLIVKDFDPYPEKQGWMNALAARIKIPLYETDGHNVVPAWTASPKKEYSAATFRKKMQPLLSSFLEDFPPLPHLHPFEGLKPEICLTLQEASSLVNSLSGGPAIEWARPGASNALAALRLFLSKRLSSYDTARNNPALPGSSDLSPWLHFGQISPHRIALETLKQPPSAGKEAYLEELIIRRELADNFCLYETKAGQYTALPEWARKSLALHTMDKRPVLYTMEELEQAKTADPLWNAAQNEMIFRGKMHGWMRMYWAKKILEWSQTPEEAFVRALNLNDRYELDGRDPNGISGVSWAIGGLHDRPWPERPIFGSVRFMNDRGAARKFRVKEYIDLVNAMIAHHIGQD
jgi:deoxyribodipyrimidine photo-lyase